MLLLLIMVNVPKDNMIGRRGMLVRQSLIHVSLSSRLERVCDAVERKCVLCVSRGRCLGV
jgi:hypothetical protein